MNDNTPQAAENHESLRHSIENVKDAAETLLQTTVDESSAEWRRARDKLAKKVRVLKSNLGGRTHDLSIKSRELGGRGQRLVQDHPWTSIGIGAGLGLLAGLLLTRRR